MQAPFSFCARQRTDGRPPFIQALAMDVDTPTG
jgi:hypothetical protein